MNRIVIMILGCCLSAAVQSVSAQVADTLSVKVDSTLWGGSVELNLPVNPTTDVKAVKGYSRRTKDSLPVYDLQGRRIKLAGRKGIYIVGGRKVVR